MSWVDDNLLVPGETVLHRSRVRGSDELVVTSRRLIYVDQRILGREVFEINLSAVENVQVQQGMLQRMLNSGTVLIGSASGNRDFEVQGVKDPMEFRRQALAAVDARA